MPRGKKGSGKPKKLSRAARRDNITKTLREGANFASELAADLQPIGRIVDDGVSLPGESKSRQSASFALFQSAKERVDKLGHESEIEGLRELKEEIEEWKDNMPESLQGGEKYSTLEETADALSSICNDLEGIDIPEFPTLPSESIFKTGYGRLEGGKDWHIDEFFDAITALADDLQEYAESVNEKADEAEQVEFPGMTG